jgi:hypothetical protein
MALVTPLHRVARRLPAKVEQGHERSVASLDRLVGMAHTDPRAAGVSLARKPELAVAPSSWGESCLQAAGHLGHRDLIVSLLARGVAADLFTECVIGDPTRAVDALEASSDLLGVHRLPILHFAVMSGNPVVVETLLEAGAPVNPRGAALTPLHAAVARRELGIAMCLLEAGADPLAIDAFGDTAVDWAAYLDEETSLLDALLSYCCHTREATR